MTGRREVAFICNTPEHEFSRQFIQGMLDRMAVSYYKYGKVADAYPHSFSAMPSLIQRLSEYDRTGNTEFLIDAANFAMIEFMAPSLPGAHYSPTDDDGSPGRTTVHGLVTKDSNTAKRDHLYRRDGD